MKNKKDIVKSPCMFPSCDSETSYTRSVCRRHYVVLLVGVARGGKTWKQFADAGMCKDFHATKRMPYGAAIHKGN